MVVPLSQQVDGNGAPSQSTQMEKAMEADLGETGRLMWRWEVERHDLIANLGMRWPLGGE